MGRLLLNEKAELDKQIAEGFITCKTCKVTRELQYFGRQKYVKPNGDIIWSYKVRKCKVCVSPKGELVKPHNYVTKNILRAPKKAKLQNDTRLTPKCKEFLKRLIYMKGYIEPLECFILVHYHLETFGYVERLIINTEEELSLMFEELLQIYYREQGKNNI